MYLVLGPSQTKWNVIKSRAQVFYCTIQFLLNFVVNSVVTLLSFNPDFIQFWEEHHTLWFFMADYCWKWKKKHFILKEECVPFLSFQCHSVTENLLTLISVFFIPVLEQGLPFNFMQLLLCVCQAHCTRGSGTILYNFTPNKTGKQTVTIVWAIILNTLMWLK